MLAISLFSCIVNLVWQEGSIPSLVKGINMITKKFFFNLVVYEVNQVLQFFVANFLNLDVWVYSPQSFKISCR